MSPASRPSFRSRRWTRRLVASSTPPQRSTGPIHPAPRRRRRRGWDTKSLSTSADDSITQSGVNAAPPSTESAAPILHLRGVGRRFGGLRAVAEVTLVVEPGERRAILGPNGAGKTTLFNVISGEFPPTEGTIELFGRDVTHQPARLRARSGLSRTFQTSKLLLGLSVEDNLYLAVLGARGGHLLPLRLPRLERPLRERPPAPAAAIRPSDRPAPLAPHPSHPPP